MSIVSQETIHYRTHAYKEAYFTVEWASKRVNTGNGRTTLWGPEERPVYVAEDGPMRETTLATRIIQVAGYQGGQDIYEAVRAPHGRELRPGEWRVLQDSDNALARWRRPLPHYDARVAYTPPGKKRPVRATLRDIIHDGWAVMGDRLIALCDERGVDTIRHNRTCADDAADVPELLDRLIDGGPLDDPWRRPRATLTEVARALTGDLGAEVLPR